MTAVDGVAESLPMLSDESASFVNQPHNLLIGGEWVESAAAKTFEVVDPATEGVVARVAEGTAEDVDRAVGAARRAFDNPAWRQMAPSHRARLLWDIADAIEAHIDELAELEALDNGKPVSVAKIVDVPLAIDAFRYMSGWATKLSGITPTASNPITPQARFFAYTLRQPIGVAGLICPWNFPLDQAALKIAPALAAGCTVVLKPAEETPLAALRLGELMQEVGLPDGVVNIITGFGDVVGAALAAHPGVDKVSFTGSTEVGRKVLQAAAGNLKKVTLELGGNAPNIVFADADLDAAVAGAASAGLFNSGQVCVAGRRLFVESSVFDEVVGRLADAAKGMPIGPGLDPSTEVGPLVSSAQFDRVIGYLEDGAGDGVEYLTGGGRAGSSGYFVQPTVAIDVSDDLPLVADEVFGPLVVAMPFDDAEEVVRRANQTPYGLAAGVWTSDITLAHLLAAEIQSGTVWVNTYNALDLALPHGGFKQSGWGREMGVEAVHGFMESKTVTVGLGAVPSGGSGDA
jgi:phenylacetaldehyde dehydrogenase